MLKNLFVPITKVDVAKRLVYGLATAELPDADNEICDYESSKPYYEKWSSDIAKATDGNSLGNLRAMHTKIAAGKITDILFNDPEKRIEIAAKVVDDSEWNKVIEGVYTGFSHGGKAVKRWKDADDATKTRYTINPSEISLADVPCLKEATFQVIKDDGQVEIRKFKGAQPSGEQAVVVVPTNAEVAAKATELAKAAGDETKWTDFIEKARGELTKVAEPKPAVAAPAAPAAAPHVAKVEGGEEAWEQVWQHPELPGKTFKKKGDLQTALVEKRAAAVADEAAAPVVAAIGEIQKALNIAAVEPPKPDAKPEPKAPRVSKLVSLADLGGTIAKALGADDKTDVVRKGLYDVGRLASLISELKWLHDTLRWEALSEGDGSAVPNQLKASLMTLCDVLRNLVAEETAEFMNDVPDVVVIEAAAGLLPHGHIDALVKLVAGTPTLAGKTNDVIQKAGARNSKADKQRIQKMHDLSVEMDAECGGDADKIAHGDIAKVRDDLTKVTAERDELKKSLDGLAPQLTAIFDVVKKIAEQPMPGGPVRTGPVDKTLDGLDLSKAAEGVDPEALLMTILKIAQQKGRPVNQIGQPG